MKNKLLHLPHLRGLFSQIIFNLKCLKGLKMYIFTIFCTFLITHILCHLILLTLMSFFHCQVAQCRKSGQYSKGQHDSSNDVRLIS